MTNPQTLITAFFVFIWFILLWINQYKLDSRSIGGSYIMEQNRLHKELERWQSDYTKIYNAYCDVLDRYNSEREQSGALRQKLEDYGIKLDQMAGNMCDSTRVIKEISMEVIDLQMRLQNFEREVMNERENEPVDG